MDPLSIQQEKSWRASRPKTTRVFTMSDSMRTPVVLLAVVALLGGCGKPQDRGVIEGAPLPAAVMAEKSAMQRSSSTLPPSDKEILFGDLHVHTTFSPDAFIMSVPLMGGSGLHPPADASSP